MSAIPSSRDSRLPHDVVIGHVTFRKGVSLSTLVQHAKQLYQFAHGTDPDAIAGRATFDAFLKEVHAPARRWGILFQLAGFWVGAHYSAFNRRWCINLLPCVTVWFTLPGGKAPDRANLGGRGSVRQEAA